jgi:hypothetical protein
MRNFMLGMLTGIIITIITYYYLRMKVIVRYIRYYEHLSRQYPSRIGEL